MHYLITYDIRNSKRLARVAKIMEYYGERVQYSVFECSLKIADLNFLKNRLRKTIDMERDSVIFYQLCETCMNKIEQFGEGRDLKDEVVIVI